VAILRLSYGERGTDQSLPSFKKVVREGGFVQSREEEGVKAICRNGCEATAGPAINEKKGAREGGPIAHHLFPMTIPPFIVSLHLPEFLSSIFKTLGSSPSVFWFACPALGQWPLGLRDGGARPSPFLLKAFSLQPNSPERAAPLCGSKVPSIMKEGEESRENYDS
jgi:hypothetical protein